VADLARKVGLSRTVFAANKTVGQIARTVGYSSEASLSKEFRRALGRAPGEYRRQQAAAHGVRATATG